MKPGIRTILVCFSLVSLGLVISSFRAVAAPAVVSKASAIQVLRVESDEIKLPAEFQISLYEDLVHQLEKSGGFQHVYRDGDKRAADVADIVILRSNVRGFKKGSEMARQVTTVSGETSINVHCQFTDKSGKVLLERDLNGKVMFFGGNLRATYDFAKKAARLAHDTFVASPGA